MKYFVSYSFVSNGQLGFGRTEVTLVNPIKSFHDIERVESLIENDLRHDNHKVVIISFEKLDEGE